MLSSSRDSLSSSTALRKSLSGPLSSPSPGSERGPMSILSGLIRLQREQQLATQSALRLGSLNFAVTMRTTGKCRKMEAELAEVQSRASEQREELQQLRSELRDVRDGAERQHAELRDAAQTQAAELEGLASAVVTYQAKLKAVQTQQESADGMLNVGIVVLCAWCLSSPVVSIPMAVVSALLRALTGRRTRSASALVGALRLAILGALVVRVRRTFQHFGLLDTRADGASHVEEVARGFRTLVVRLAAALRHGAVLKPEHQELLRLVVRSCAAAESAARKSWQAAKERVRACRGKLGGAALEDAEGVACAAPAAAPAVPSATPVASSTRAEEPGALGEAIDGEAADGEVADGEASSPEMDAVVCVSPITAKFLGELATPYCAKLLGGHCYSPKLGNEGAESIAERFGLVAEEDKENEPIQLAD